MKTVYLVVAGYSDDAIDGILDAFETRELAEAYVKECVNTYSYRPDGKPFVYELPISTEVSL
jgi:hypothetical protein